MLFGVVLSVHNETPVCFPSLPLSLVITSSCHLQGNSTVEKKSPLHSKERENMELRKWRKALGCEKIPE